MNKTILLFFICFLGLEMLTAQTTLPLTKVSRSNYQYGDRIDRLHKLEDIFQVDSQSVNLFNGYNRARKAQRNANIVAFSTLALSSVGTQVFVNNCNGSSELCGLSGAFTWVTINVIGVSYALFANIISGSKKAAFKKDLLLQFNKLSLENEPRPAIHKPITSLLTYSEKTKLWSKGNISGKLHTLGPSIIFDKQTLDLFGNYDYYRRQEKRRFITAGILGGAVLTMTVVNNTIVSKDTAKDSGHIKFTQIYPGLATVFTGALAFISKNKRMKVQQDLVNYHNGFLSPPDLGMNTAPTIDIIMGSYGIGLAYTF